MAVLRLNLNAVDQLVAQPLMVALAMVMDHEVGERASEVPLSWGVTGDGQRVLLALFSAGQSRNANHRPPELGIRDRTLT